MTQKMKTGISSAQVARKTLPEVGSRRIKVAVLFAVNNGYAPYLGVALASSVEHAGTIEWLDAERRTPYYEPILCTNIRAILRGEKNKKFTRLRKIFLG